MQACDIEEDGLFAFDLHSDGDGQRYFFVSLVVVSFGDLRQSLNEHCYWAHISWYEIHVPSPCAGI